MKIRYSFLVLLLSYFALANYATWQIPLSAGTDEVAHFLFARFLYREDYLPLNDDDRKVAGYKSDQPPLNAALIAATLFWYPDGDQRPYVKLNEILRHQLIIDDFNLPKLTAINTIDPATGEIFIWRWGRWLSILCNVLTLTILYRAALTFFRGWPNRPDWAVATVMSVTFLPSFIFISGVLTYENLLGLWLALYLWLALRLLIRPDFSIKLTFWAGIFIGLGMVTKLSALVAPASFLMLWGLKYKTTPKPYRALLSGLLGILLAGGWWFGLVVIELNQVNQLGWVAGLAAPIINADGSDETSSKILAGADLSQIPAYELWRKGVNRLSQTLWVRNPDEFYAVMLWLTRAALVGLIYVIIRYPYQRRMIIFLALHGLLFTILPLIRLGLTQQISVAMQGHHVLMPALGVFALFLTVGLGGWHPRRGYWGGVMLGLGLAWYSLTLIGQINHSPISIRTVAPYLPTTATALAKEFSAIELVGYQSELQPHRLSLMLYFHVNDLIATDYLISTQLLNQHGEAVSAWLGHGLDGLAPTRAWEPGDGIYQQTWLPLVGLPDGKYTVIMKIAGVTPEPVTLMTFNLTASPPHSTIAIWQHGEITITPATFRERATIQLTANEPITLINPQGISYPPNLVTGNTAIYIVDPLWPRGNYQIKAGNNSAQLQIYTKRRQTTTPPNLLPQPFNFANLISLISYELPQAKLPAHQAIPMQLYWQAIETIPANVIMFVRVHDAQGQVWGGYDRLPQETYSPLLWAKGEIVPDNFTLNLKPDTPAGQYYLDLGFYLPMGEAAISLPLVENGQPTAKTSITLGPIMITDD